MNRKNLTREEQLRKKHRQWYQHFVTWQKSGMTQAEYCRRNNLSSKCFTYWKRKFKQQSVQNQLVPVPQVGVREAFAGKRNSAALKVELSSRYTIEVPEGFSSATLSRLISVLTAR